MNYSPAAKPIMHLRVWPEETQSPASTVSNVKAVLRIACAETGADTCMLGVADDDSQSSADDNVRNTRSLKHSFLESNATAIEKCLHTQNIVAYGCVRFGWNCNRDKSSSQAACGIVLVPVLHEDIPHGCLLLIFAEPMGCRTLHPTLRYRLLHLGQTISVLLGTTRCGKSDAVLMKQHSATFTQPLPGRLSELKSVLEGGVTTWEDIGEQLSSYLQGSGVVETTNCDRPDKKSCERPSRPSHDKNCTPLAKTGPVFSTGRNHSVVRLQHAEGQ